MGLPAAPLSLVHAQALMPPHVPGRLLVKFRAGVAPQTQERVLERYAIESEGVLAQSQIQVVDVAVGEEANTLRLLQASQLVEWAEPDYIATASAMPNDPYYVYQWGLSMINAPAAWDVQSGISTVTIAILDTGVDLTHPDLVSQMVNGYDFVNNDADPADDHGHGTHVASIAAASGNNGVGLAGVAWNVKIMPVKVLANNGSGSYSGIANAVIWAVDQGADIINMSLGGNSYSQTLQDAITYAHNLGAVVIAAAGNGYESGNAPNYPAANNHVIGVGATTQSNTCASFSTTGYFVDIAAPGVSIVGAYLRSKGYSYVYMSGTSMATPYVAGLAALLLSVDDTLTPDEVQAFLANTAVDLGDAGRDDIFGAGRIDAASAVNAVFASLPTATPTPTVYSEQPTATASDTFTPTDTPSSTPTVTPSKTPTPIPTQTATQTWTATATATETATSTFTHTATPSSTLTDVPENTATPTATATDTATDTATPTPFPVPTETPSHTPTPLPSEEAKITAEPTLTSTETPIPTQTLTETPMPSATPTVTATHLPTATFTPSETPTATQTPTATYTPTDEPTPTSTATNRNANGYPYADR